MAGKKCQRLLSQQFVNCLHRLLINVLIVAVDLVLFVVRKQRDQNFFKYQGIVL